MKSIGIVDYYLSEWHANNYPAWIKRAAQALGLDIALRYAYGEQEISPVDGVSGSAWCAKEHLEQCFSLEEIAAKSDYLMILAPSNPEKHLAYARKIFPFSKPCFVDKTFAPNAKEAAEILNLAARYKTPIFSSSALRYASELGAVENPESLMSMGGGRSVEEYIIHQVEMVIAALHEKPLDVFCEPLPGQTSFCVRFEKGKQARLLYANPLPFAVYLKRNDQEVYCPITSDFFAILLEKILAFFASGKAPFDPQETSYAMALRDAILLSQSKPFTWQRVVC